MTKKSRCGDRVNKPRVPDPHKYSGAGSRVNPPSRDDRLGTDGCNLIWGVNLSHFLGIMYFSTEVVLFESNIRCQ